MLNIPRSADEKAIKKAYRKAAMKYHPDRQSSKTDAEKKAAERMFKDIGEGYGILSDAKKRRMYDRGMDAQEIEQGGSCGQGHGHGGIDPQDLFRMFMSRGGGGKGGGGFPF